MFAPKDDSDGNVAAIARREWLLCFARRIIALAVLAAVAASACRGYTSWRERGLANEARAFCDRGDFRSAETVARRVLRFDAGNRKAWRVLAETAEAQGNSEAVLWRQRLALLQPQNTDDQFSLAEAALRFHQIDLAGKVLAALPLAAHDCARYHTLSGRLAVAEKQTSLAEAHFGIALRMEPADPRHQLDLAAIRIDFADRAKSAEARATLARLALLPALRRSALRVLAAEALARRDFAAAAEWSAALCAEPAATFADRLLHLDAMRDSPALAAELRNAQKIAAESPSAAAEMIAWMNQHNLAGAVIQWLPSLPARIVRVHPVPLAVAESYSVLQDWTALRNWVEGKKWGAEECLRTAVESHALRRLRSTEGSAMDADALWQSALKAAGDSTDQLATLAALAEGWGDVGQCEEAWWLVANGGKNPRSALVALSEHYRAQQNSFGLLRVAKRTLELNPADDEAATQYANLGLLLRGSGMASRLASELYAKNPQNPSCAAAYAFALFVQNKTGQAVQVLASLQADQLQKPVIAAYYLVLLVGDGQMERAQPFLPLAQKATLLPEEQKLVAEAARKIVQWEAKAAQNLAHS